METAKSAMYAWKKRYYHHVILIWLLELDSMLEHGTLYDEVCMCGYVLASGNIF